MLVVSFVVFVLFLHPVVVFRFDWWRLHAVLIRLQNNSTYRWRWLSGKTDFISLWVFDPVIFLFFQLFVCLCIFSSISLDFVCFDFDLSKIWGQDKQNMMKMFFLTQYDWALSWSFCLFIQTSQFANLDINVPVTSVCQMTVCTFCTERQTDLALTGVSSW